MPKTFGKPLKDFEDLNIYGENIVGSEGHQWMRYRKACASSFSDRNLQLVWDASVRLMNEIFASWSTEKVVRVPVSCVAGGVVVITPNPRNRPRPGLPAGKICDKLLYVCDVRIWHLGERSVHRPRGMEHTEHITR